MLNQDLPQSKEGETTVIPEISDPALCERVVEYLDKVLIYDVDKVDAEIELGSEDKKQLPQEFKIFILVEKD